MADFDAFLLDHAAAEKKASGMAISMLSHYPDRVELVAAMAELAVEELTHYREVVKWIHRRGLLTAADRKMLIKLAEDMGKAGLAGAGQGEFTRAFLDGIPVEMASRDLSNGTLTVEEQVKVIELKPVPDALFEVPAGYRASAWEDEHAGPQAGPQRRGPPQGQPQPRAVPPGQPPPAQPR